MSLGKQITENTCCCSPINGMKTTLKLMSKLLLDKQTAIYNKGIVVHCPLKSSRKVCSGLHPMLTRQCAAFQEHAVPHYSREM